MAAAAAMAVIAGTGVGARAVPATGDLKRGAGRRLQIVLPGQKQLLNDFLDMGTTI